MEPRPLEPGEIVQLNPAMGRPTFSACLMVVTEPKPWGAVGYVVVADGKGSYRAPFRAEWADMEPTGGRAVWIEAEGDGGDNGGDGTG